MSTSVPTVNIFDHGLSTRAGHHYDYCHSIAKRLVQRGFAVAVCGYSGASVEVAAEFEKIGCSFVRLFSCFAYTYLKPELCTLQTMEAIASRAASEMASVAPADYHLFPTLTPEHFLAYAMLDDPRPTAGMVHAEPNFSHAMSGTVWALASEKARQRQLKPVVGAIDPLIGAFLQTFVGDLPVCAMPIPQDGVCRGAYCATVDTIGFFGHQRRERGLPLIPPLVDRLLALGHHVVLHDTAGRFGTNGQPTHLRLLGFVDDLNAEIATCDLVVCPMERANYVHRTSGIVASAVACGVPLVLPAGTLPALRIQHLRSSRCYHEHSVDGILHAIDQAAANYPSLSAGARHGARLWQEQHGVDRFISQVLERLGP